MYYVDYNMIVLFLLILFHCEKKYFSGNINSYKLCIYKYSFIKYYRNLYFFLFSLGSYNKTL